MLKPLLKYKWHIVFIVILMIVEPVINSVLGFWLQGLYNTAKPGAPKIAVLRLFTAGFLLWMLKRCVSFTTNILRSRFVCNAKQEVKRDLFNSLLFGNLQGMDRMAPSGEYLSLFTNDITILETRFFAQIISLISSVLSLVILGAAFLRLNRTIASAILLFGLFTMLIPAAFSKRLNEKNLQFSKTLSRFTQQVKEYMTAFPTIKNYSAEGAFERKFGEINTETENMKFDFDYSMGIANNIGSMFSWFMQFLGVGIGLMLLVNGDITIGTVIAAQSFTNDLAFPLQDIVANINSIRSVRKLVQKLEVLTSGRIDSSQEDRRIAHEEDLPVSSHLVLGQGGCDLRFNNLGLTIGGQTIVYDFSYSFEAGKKYLIIGMNGSGKSTMLKMLKKWYGDCSGTIEVNGVDIRMLTNQQISEMISYMGENVSFFSGTIRQNIELFHDSDPQLLSKALTSAQVYMDLNRQIIDEGRNISSGEQRRIEIARSLLKSARAIIFDEVISTLDVKTAYEIEKLALGFEDKTVIFVSHNFSGKLIRQYDNILVMDKGRLIAHGTYEELFASSEYFREVCEIKFG